MKPDMSEFLKEIVPQANQFDQELYDFLNHESLSAVLCTEQKDPISPSIGLHPQRVSFIFNKDEASRELKASNVETLNFGIVRGDPWGKIGYVKLFAPHTDLAYTVKLLGNPFSPIRGTLVSIGPGSLVISLSPSNSKK